MEQSAMTPVYNQIYDQARNECWAEIVRYKVLYVVNYQANLGVRNQVSIVIPRFQVRDKLR